MQGETGSLRDLKRYHLEQHHTVPRTILEDDEDQVPNNVETKDDCDVSDVSDVPPAEEESEHLLRLREFQVKLLASSNTAYNSRARSGRRHTLCLTR